MASTNEGVREEQSTTRPKPLWLNRDFLLLWSGQTISTIGTGISQFAYRIASRETLPESKMFVPFLLEPLGACSQVCVALTRY